MAKKKSNIMKMAGNYRRQLKRKGIETLTDAQGSDVPIGYVPDRDLIKHMRTLELVERAKAIRESLALLKADAQAIGDEIHEQILLENDISSKSKGGFWLQTFDRSARVEYRMDTVEEVDPEMLMLCREAKDKYVAEMTAKMNGEVAEIIPLLEDVFESSRGEIDTRKLRSMNKYRTKIRNKWFQKFLDYGNEAISLRHTKRFETYQERDDQGEDKSIVLTYSRVDPAVTVREDLQNE